MEAICMCVISGRYVATCCEKVAKTNPGGVDLVPIKVFHLNGTDIAHNADKIDELKPGILIDTDEKGFYYAGKKLDTDLKDEITPSVDGYYDIPSGVIEIRLPNIQVPMTATGFCFPRSSFNRLGIIKCETAVWDSGYSGEGSATFYFPFSARIHKSVAWVQFVMISNEAPADEGYNGHYQHEVATAAIWTPFPVGTLPAEVRH
jgi:deoxycytidine triphosphate deaminase